MVEAKKTAAKAKRILHSLYEREPFSSVHVDEVEWTDGGVHWLITLRFVPPDCVITPGAGPWPDSSPEGKR